MGMSTSVVGFKPPDEKWRKMRDAWKACQAAGVEPPREVSEFFEWDEPDDQGVEVGRVDLVKCGAVQDWENDHASGYEVDLTKLPKDVKVLRFYNSW